MAEHADIVVIGGGAAGFFAAIQASISSKASVLILEKSQKLLSKVKISGGGRCNVTHAAFDNKTLLSGYPRGTEILKNAFEVFAVRDTIRWFEEHGVPIKKEADGRMFPKSNSSQSIVDCLMREADAAKVQIRTGTELTHAQKTKEGFLLETNQGVIRCRALIVCSGGPVKENFLTYLGDFRLPIVPPVPSLFTFNLPGQKTADIMGVSVSPARVTLPAFNYSAEGPLLFTHWGLSGPVILKLSAFCARELHACGYETKVQVDLLPTLNPEKLKENLRLFADSNGKKQVLSLSPFTAIPLRLWQWLMAAVVEMPQRNWAECGKKQREGMIAALKARTFEMKGKTTFKEEFVTCGGIATSAVDPQTMMCQQVPGLYFAGEVLDIDGITGGYNFQAAWTTGYSAGKSAAGFVGRE